ncbi:MAG TPA: iron uptake porin [Leptolyngbya sp.]|nr:iron uptake porin [Leptolyngbya sp.]
MSNNSWKSLLVNPVLLSATLTVSAVMGASSIAGAAEMAGAAESQADTVKTNTTQTVPSLDSVSTYSNEAGVSADSVSADSVSANDAGQVTSVSQLSDVRPTDWAFQALQSLVERYGCIAGYPDKTYRGNRAMTRYEFAAGVNACLDRVNELIAASTADLVKKEDLATLQKLQEQFAAELATLRGRVDSVEARTTTIERQQFSTTTKLRGEAIFAISGAQGDNLAVPVGAAPSATAVSKNTTFSDRVRLILNTSFTGKDTLFTRLQARNLVPFSGGVTGTNMTRLSFDGNEGNSISIDKLFYRLPIGKGAVTFDAFGGEFYSNVPTLNPLFASDSQGSISRFGRFNPIYRNAQGGSGATLNLPISNALTASVGYLASNANNSIDKQGLFNGSNAALAQLSFKPTTNLDLALTYVRSYTNFDGVSNGVTTSTGSGFANNPFAGAATAASNYGIEGAFKITPGLTVGAWGGYTQAFREGTGGRADIWNWAVSLGFPDLGGKGNLAGIIFGMPPKVTRNTTNPNRDDNGGTAYHLEGLYRLQLNNNISITPGIIVIFNPEHNDANNTEYVGTIRTTFAF